MTDDEPGIPPGTDPDTRSQGTEGDGSIAVAVGTQSDVGSDGHGDVRSLAGVDLNQGDDSDMERPDSLSVDVGDDFGDEDELELDLGAGSENDGDLDVELSPWAPLLGMLDATEPEPSPGDRPFTPAEGVERAHALELRAESMLQFAARGAQRAGALDRTEVGLCDDNRDVVAGRDEVEVYEALDEHTGRGLVVVADEVKMTVEGPLRMEARLEDNVIMAGVMTDEWAGGTLIAAAMSDDMAAGVGHRCTAPLDLWAVHLVGMEERPGTCAADGLLFELAATLYEREYVSSVHGAVVARFQGTTATTMKSGFRPLMKTAIGVRNLVPGGGGGGGDASAAPPAAPPAPGGGEAGAATLTAAEGGEAIGRGVAGGDDTDEIASVVRTVETVSETAEVEDLQHPASTADNLDDLARVDVEGEGYQQVAEIYEQPVPAADDTSGAGAAASGPSRNEPPALYSTDPGTEGYNFNDAYGSLHDRNQFYRRELNMRGNLFTREYLSELDSKALELLAELGRNADDVAIDNYGLRTPNVYATLQEMAQEAELAGDADALADIRAAMEQLEGFAQDTLAQLAAHTDEFQGTALGSQHVLDPNIDVDKLRHWLQDQLQATQQTMMDPQTSFEDMQRLSWTQDYYDQMLKALDAGIDPLAESSEQVAFLFTKTDGQAQVDVYLELQDGLMTTLSDPEFFRSAQEMGLDAFTPPVRDRIVADDAFLGPSSLGSPPPREPPALYIAEPGTEGYKFDDAFDSLRDQQQFYREEFNFRGNFFLREYIQEIDAKALELFTDVGGATDAIQGDSFGHSTSSIYHKLQAMAEEADAAGDVSRATDIRAAMAEIEGLVNSTLTEVAARADEFAGTAVGAQGGPIDPNIDKVRLRGWLQNRLDEAAATFDAAETAQDMQVATWERGYYELMIESLDHGMNPLALSNEEIAILRINKIEPYYAEAAVQFADEIAAAAAQGDQFVIPRPRVEDQVDLYARLQELLVSTLADPAFHRSADEMGSDAYAAALHSRIEAQLDFLGADSVLPRSVGEIPPPLPAVDFADGAVYIDDVRDRSFSRSALAASEETLERRATSLAEEDAAVGNRVPDPGSGITEPLLSPRRTSPDDAQAPIIDHRSGQWVSEPYAEPNSSQLLAGGASTASPVGDGVPPPASDVTWESGLQVSGDADAGPSAGEADTPNLFKPAAEPQDMDSTGVDETHHAPGGNDDGASGSLTARPDDTEGEDANPTGAVSEPGDSTTAYDAGDGAGPGRSGTTPSVTPDTPDSVPTGARRDTPGTDAGPAGATAADPDAGATGTRSNLFGEPESFEGRSLEGAPRSDDPKELARSVDGAEIPVEELPRVDPDAAEPGRKPILGNSDGSPAPDTYEDVPDTAIQQRLVQAQYNKRVFNDSTIDADSVWRDTMWSGDRRDVAALREANARWSEGAAVQRTSTVSFGDDSSQLLYHVEYDDTAYTRRRSAPVDRYRGAARPNTIDRAHSAHYVPGPRGWEPAREPGFGRLSQGWNEFPFSPRERIVNTLSRGEALSPEQITALESGLESYRAAGNELTSSQYRAMTDMIADLGDEYRHARWYTLGTTDQRLVQLIEMLDYAAVA